jgi:hypothetical protein
VSLETQPDPREAKQNSTVRSEIVETLKSFPLSIACFASALEHYYAVHVLTTKQCAQTGRAVKFESCLHAVAAQRPEDGHTSLVEGHVHMNAGSLVRTGLQDNPPTRCLVKGHLSRQQLGYNSIN